MSTRGTARNVRQRKLNTKQALHIVRESEVEDNIEDESQRNIPQVETGVEKGEEIEFHLQAVINASNAAVLGAKTEPNYIPTPEASKAQGVKYDVLYPKVFAQPATYIRFSSTVEDSVGVNYCMNDDDVEFLSKLNDGKDADGRDRKDKLSQCSEDTFEEVINFFEETSARIQPFTAVDNAPILTLEELEQHLDENVSADAQRWTKPIYKYWVQKKGNRALMPSIKVRMLDNASDADDADPYVCFRRREVRQTRKTRGRDAQVVEKLKKLRVELESGRNLLQMVVQREQMNKENLEISRKVFEERRKLKEVKVTKNIVGEKGDDEDLLVNQKPVSKPKGRQDQAQRVPPLRLRPGAERAPDEGLDLLSDRYGEAEDYVNKTIENRKEQHKKWNNHWKDSTWLPITPPPDDGADAKWKPFPPENLAYPSPPASVRSEASPKDTDVEMQDQPPVESVEDTKPDATAGASPEPEYITSFIPGAFPMDIDPYEPSMRNAAPACRLRYGRGGRCHLESRKRRARGMIQSGVISDSDSDEDDGPEYYPASDNIVFEYRCALNSRPRPEGAVGEKRQLGSGDQAAAAAGQGPAIAAPQQATAGSTS